MHAILFSLPGLAGPLLRRRDRDGRQRLPRRPRRRAHADAVDRRPQRRLLARRLRPALRAAADGPGLRLPGGQRRGPAAHADVAAALAQALHRAAQGAPGLRPGHATSRWSRPTRRSSPTSARYEDDVVLCVHNLARSAQAVELDLSAYEGRWPEEMLGRTRFPRIGELPYLLTLAPRGLLLVPAQGGPRRRHGARPMASVDLADARRGDARRVAARPPLVRLQGARRRPRPRPRRRRRSHDGPPRWSLGAGRGALPGRHARRLPAAARASAPRRLRRRGASTTSAASTVYDAFADPRGLRAARRPAARAAPRSHGEHARVEFHWREDVEPPRGRRRRAPDRRRAVQHLDRLRRRARAQGLPPRRGGRQPRARDAALPHRARLPQHRRARRLVRVRGRAHGRHARRRAALRARRAATAGSSRSTSSADDPERFVARLRDLGAVIGRMHTVLASDPTDPAFAPEEPSRRVAGAAHRDDRRGDRAALPRPARRPRRSAPIAGRGEEVRDRLQLLSHVGARGKLIRHHGDLHLGQTLLRRRTAGSSSTSRASRRGRCSSAAASARRCATSRACCARSPTPPRPASSSAARPAPEGWEDRAREAFLAGYLDDRRLRPCCRPARRATRTLLSIFELEKAVYELRYELNNRPDWVRIPVAGIARLLEEPPCDRRDRHRGHRRTATSPIRTGCSARTRTNGGVVVRAFRPAADAGRRAPRGRRAGRARASATRPALFEGDGRRARRCRCATSSRSPTRDGRDAHAARPVRVRADARRDRPAPRRRGPPRGALREARRARRARSTASPGVAFAVWAPSARSVSRRRRLQLLGRAPAPDALARRVGHLGAVRPRRGRGLALQVRDPRARTATSS